MRRRKKDWKPAPWMHAVDDLDARVTNLSVRMDRPRRIAWHAARFAVRVLLPALVAGLAAGYVFSVLHLAFQVAVAR